MPAHHRDFLVFLWIRLAFHEWNIDTISFSSSLSMFSGVFLLSYDFIATLVETNTGLTCDSRNSTFFWWVEFEVGKVRVDVRLRAFLVVAAFEVFISSLVPWILVMYKFLLRGFLTSTFTSRFIVFSKFENILSFQIAMSVNPFLLESCTNTVESLLSSTHLADLKKIGNKFLDYKKHKNKSPCSQESRFPNEQSNVELGNRGGTRSIAVYHIAQNPPPSLKITRFSSHRVGFSNSTAHVVHRGG